MKALKRRKIFPNMIIKTLYIVSMFSKNIFKYHIINNIKNKYSKKVFQKEIYYFIELQKKGSHLKR